jgi:two-component system chemotaxis sensor kinase CheA
MITREEHDQMTDADSEHLIFRSGLSTKDEATDISGRGVGLDVVRSNIRKWSGEIALKNRPGEGMSIRLTFPITNTLLTKEAILLKLARQTFCLPLEYVVEIVRIPAERLHRHRDQAVFEHRGQVINVIDIKGLMGISTTSEDARKDRTFILLHGLSRSRTAICADEILGQQKIVLKDFEIEDFRRLPYCQGLTLLGDGRVVLVLDAEKIAG